MGESSETLAHTMQRPSRLRVGELGLRSWVHVQSALMARRHRQEMDGDEASPWRKRFLKVGGAMTVLAGTALAVQSLRATGTTSNSLEDLGVTEAFAAKQPLLAQHEVSDLVAIDAPDLKPEEVEITEARIDTDGYDFDLPTNVDHAPNSVPLGEWDKKSGHGTIWNQTIAYANELGFGDLTERQKWDMTQHVLDENDMTWQDARRLSPNFEPELPTQREMVDWLEQEGAERTHTADIPVPEVTVPDVPEQPVPPPPTVTPPPVPESEPPVVVAPPNETLPPGPVEGKWDMRDMWAALGLTGVLLVAYGGQQALNRGKTEKEMRESGDEAAAVRADAAEADAEAARAQANEAAAAAAAAGGGVVVGDAVADDEARRRAADAADAEADRAEARAEAAREEERRAKEKRDDDGSLKKLAAAAAVAAAGKWLWEWFKRRATPGSVIRRK
jgi:hypothetical protein